MAFILLISDPDIYDKLASVDKCITFTVLVYVGVMDDIFNEILNCFTKYKYSKGGIVIECAN